MRALLISLIIVLASVPLRADRFTATRVLPLDEQPNDARLSPLKDLNGYFPFVVPSSLDAWNARKAEVQRRILVSNGLWPMPARPPVKATIHGRLQREGYTVERAYFESYPGFYVTGNLYRPTESSGPFPAVVSPHGHWERGRFYDAGPEAIRQQIFNGAERFEVSGRYPLQARCVQLARMGCVVFHYDMIGYADSQQISDEVAHRHSNPRPEMEGEKGWGLYSAQAELRLQNVMGLQTFNSLRAVDFVTSLPDVDASRIAATGASGGGTQTMILAAIDPRITVSFPAVMVSTAMQGGCTCENATCLRVGTGNVEFAGLFAPRPQGLNAADDWTVELAQKGLPELRQLYALFGAEERVAGYALTQFPHNYNYVSRGKMYHWLNRHLKLGHPQPVIEQDFTPLTVDEMTVWDEAHPPPPAGIDFERNLLAELSAASAQQLAQLLPTSQQAMPKWRKVVLGALETILDTDWSRTNALTRRNLTKEDAGDYWLFRDLLRDPESKTELPAISLHPKAWEGDVVVWASRQGKASLMNNEGQPRDEVKLLLDAGFSIISCDLFQQGEFLADEQTLTQTRRVENARDFAGYTFGYNRTLIAHQVHDLLALIKYVLNDPAHDTEEIHLVGVEGAAPQVALAGAIARGKVTSLAIDDGDFRFAKLRSWRDPLFLPGAVKYGDLPVMLGLNAPRTLWLATADGDVPAVTQQVYSVNRADVAATAKSASSTHQLVHWLTTR